MLLQHTMFSNQRVSGSISIGDADFNLTIGRLQQAAANRQVVVARFQL